jgi:hypothetical protein
MAGKLYLKARFSCMECAWDEAIHVRLSLGFASSVSASSLEIRWEDASFEIQAQGETVVESLSDADVLNLSNGTTSYPRFVDFVLHPIAGDFRFGTLTIEVQTAEEEPTQLATLAIGYAMDEQAIRFSRTDFDAVSNSLNELYDDGLIDIAEYVRHDCSYVFQDAIYFRRVSSQPLTMTFEYQSSTIRVTRQILRTDSIALEYTRLLELRYQETPMDQDWRSDELDDLLVLFLAYLVQSDAIDNDLYQSELALLPNRHVILNDHKLLILSQRRFEAAADPYFHNIPPEQTYGE